MPGSLNTPLTICWYCDVSKLIIVTSRARVVIRVLQIYLTMAFSI